MFVGTKKQYILGIESSCDETAAAVVADGREVIANQVATQVDLHQKYGGVVPEIAARAHIENIIPILRETLAQADRGRDDLDAVAVASCPGLTPALLIGVTAAKALAWAWDKPLVAVNHIHAHIQSVLMDQTEDPYPALALVVSGGHSSLYHCQDPLALELVGQTLDDAAGEAFDKVAAILRLPYPGGPSVEKMAADGDPQAIAFPRTWLGKDSLDFSFSGIKTAVLYHCRGQNMLGDDRVPTMGPQEKADIAASFQAAVVEVLVKKTLTAAERFQAKTVLLGGGVACNSVLREQLQASSAAQGIRLLIAPKKYCTDNAAMVAAHAYYKLQAGQVATLDLEPAAGHVL